MANNPPPQTPPGSQNSGIPFGTFNAESSGAGGQTYNNPGADARQQQNGNNTHLGLVFGSPYYINPSENLGQSIVAETLDGSNYQTWQRAVRMALKTKHKLGFIDGTLPMPDHTHPDFVLWDASNTMVLCWILNSVHKDISRSVLQHENAKVVWDELKARFGRSNAIKLSNLQDEMAACKQGNMSVTQYYITLKGLWEEIQQYSPVVECDCLAVRVRPCAAVVAYKQKLETDYLIKFLKGLKSDYDVIQSQILMLKPLPAVEVALDDVLQHEQKLQGDKGKSTRGIQSVALAAQGQSDQNKNLNSNKETKYENAREGKFCRYCKMSGHLKEECYRLKNKKARMAEGGGFVGSVSQSDSQSGDSISSGQSAGYESKSSSTGSLSFTNEELNKLRQLLQQPDSMSPSPPLSPSIKHASFSVSQHLPSQPNYAGKYVLSSYAQHGLMALTQVWILDSGASDHIACTLAVFKQARSVSNQFVYLPNGSKVEVSHIGSVQIPNGLILQDVLLVPSFTFNLVSISKLTHDLPISLLFESDSCHIQDQTTKNLIGSAKQDRGLYHLTLPSRSTSDISSHQVATTYNFLPHQIDLWHWRLGHPSRDRENQATGCNRTSFKHCPTCHLAKQKKLPFPISDSRAISAFDMVHVDIWGPLAVKSHDGFSYFLSIVDDHTRSVWVFLMKQKSEASHLLESFCVMIQNQFSKTVKVIRSDQGGEFHMIDFYNAFGIEHQLSCVETPEQNARVERKHQHILNVARALRFQSGLPLHFWSDCILHAVYLINRLPSPVTDGVSPFELLYHKQPALDLLKVFGCLCYASTLLRDRTKFSPRARQCVFLGFLPGIKGYKLFDLNTHQTFVSRHVVFYETIIPFLDPSSSTSVPTSSPPQPTYSSNTPIFPNNPIPPDPFFSSSTPSQTSPPSSSTPSSSTPPSSPSFPSATDTLPASSVGEVVESSGVNSEGEDELVAQLEFEDVEGGPELRKSDRIRTVPVWHKDYKVGAVSKYSMDKYVTFDKLPPAHKTYVMSAMAVTEPKTYEEACKELCWREAMKDESDALEANQTWEPAYLPTGKRAIGCKWVYKVKLRADGTIERFKARLVAKGFTQIYGIDFLDTFSPVAKINSVKVLLAVAAANDWLIHQMDVSNAFLHGELNEEVYMKPPPGMNLPDKRMVLKLKKSLYGLKQASRQWFAKLASSLLKNGFAQTASDYSMFVKRIQGRMLIVLVYVDDILIAGASLGDIEQLKLFLGREFKVKDLGDLKFFLGLEVYRDVNGIHVNQRKYCMELLEDTGYLEAKDCLAPIDYKLKLSAKQGEPLPNPEVYKRLVGRLHYLTITRPDLTFAIQQLCQYQKDPYSEHLQAAYRILRYLKHAPGQGLLFKSDCELKLRGFSDSDWASCPDTRRSITGYCTLLGDSLITWKSKKQSTVSRSSSEAEYRALAHLVCELQWLKGLLAEMGVKIPLPVQVYCDNRSAIHIAENPVFHERTKHIEIDCHITRERLKSGLIKLEHVRTEDQLADLFTKGMTRYRLKFLLSKLGVLDIHSPTCGGVLEQIDEPCCAELENQGRGKTKVEEE
ncbi:unnamed protein product [Linum trigynum]|uniref:Integrase catalytic domain-containing protein n=1 Tax=Linum trigynum TaxID=586398 RepID=A0AAV2DPG7_9ROSI